MAPPPCWPLPLLVPPRVVPSPVLARPHASPAPVLAPPDAGPALRASPAPCWSAPMLAPPHAGPVSGRAPQGPLTGPSSAFRCSSECRSRALAKPPERARGAEESPITLSEPLSVLAFRKGLEKRNTLRNRLPAALAWYPHSAAMTPA